MNEEIHEIIIDLLTKKATYGLDSIEQTQLDEYNSDASISEDETFEMAAAAVGLVGLRTNEPLPAHLHARLMTSADTFFACGFPIAAIGEPDPVIHEEPEYQKVFAMEPVKRSWNWLGWALAGAACIALAINIGLTRLNRAEVASVINPPSTPEKESDQQLYAKLSSEPGSIKASMGVGNVKELKDISGDVVWSDTKQKGYMRLHGLPVNDVSKETYQLWIFDKTQDKATPIDGGTFDIDKNGDVLIPINAKLKAKQPEMFAITVERPGGVVVSKRDRIAALAKVETQAKTST